MIKATYIDHMGNDLSVVNAARVSFDKQSSMYEDRFGVWHLEERDVNLIKYLAAGMSSKDIEKWKNQMITANDPDTVMEAYDALRQAEPHMSPFGHVFASFRVEAPIFVARQLVKHKFLRWNEVSRRYVDDEPEFYTPDVWRGRSADKKQGSYGVIENIEPDFVESLVKWAMYDYNYLLQAGVAPEQARMLLPQNTMTAWRWSGSLDAFASMCKLRCKDDTQYETRLVANQISKEMGKLFPVSWSALINEQ